MKPIIIAIIGLILLTGCVENAECLRREETRIITDIISISPGGLGPSTCILQTEQGKISMSGDVRCQVQIGDTIIKRVDTCTIHSGAWKRNYPGT